ncbi:hypothetical protein HPB50_013571 [Hyalomma asiaticum]|uniref:Uncharacterized protein n=1 Tax=Hyalomma asiaticum TaxID=266040 RepID=A0ACB7RNX2_HYAAI|nr:hypothetical protein HPB50_013571 [Hyalomma asiaticum]
MADSGWPTNAAPEHSTPAEGNRRKSANGTQRLPSELMAGGTSGHPLPEASSIPRVSRRFPNLLGLNSASSVGYVVRQALRTRRMLATFGRIHRFSRCITSCSVGCIRG